MAREWTRAHTEYLTEKFLEYEEGDGGWNPKATNPEQKKIYAGLYKDPHGTPFHSKFVGEEKFLDHFKKKSKSFFADKVRNGDEHRRAPVPPQDSAAGVFSDDGDLPSDDGGTPPDNNGSSEASPQKNRRKNEPSTSTESSGGQKPEPSDRNITIPSIAVSYKTVDDESRIVDRSYGTGEALSGWDPLCEENGALSLREDGSAVDVLMTTRTLYNSAKIFSSNKFLREIYGKKLANGKKHTAKIAFENTVKEHHFENGKPVPWKASISLPESCTSVTGIEALKESEVGEQEIFYYQGMNTKKDDRNIGILHVELERDLGGGYRNNNFCSDGDRTKEYNFAESMAAFDSPSAASVPNSPGCLSSSPISSSVSSCDSDDHESASNSSITDENIGGDKKESPGRHAAELAKMVEDMMISKIGEKHDHLEARIDAIKISQDGISEALRTLQATSEINFDTLQNRIRLGEDKFDELNCEFKELERKSSSQDLINESLSDNVELLRSNIRTLQAKLKLQAALVRELKSFRKKIVDEMGERVDALEFNMNTIELTNDGLKGELERQAAKIQDLLEKYNDTKCDKTATYEDVDRILNGSNLNRCDVTVQDGTKQLIEEQVGKLASELKDEMNKNFKQFEDWYNQSVVALEKLFPDQKPVEIVRTNQVPLTPGD